MTNLPIVFLGPVRAGKTTLARQVAQALGLTQVSLDEVRWNYYREIGYDDTLARQIRAEGGFLALVFYRQLFDAYSVERVISDYPQAVIDCGAGVGPYEDQRQLKRLQDLFTSLQNIFLILPSPDVQESLRILRQRDANPPADLSFDIIAHFLRHPGYRQLAKHVIYNQDKTPEQTTAEIISLLL